MSRFLEMGTCPPLEGFLRATTLENPSLPTALETEAAAEDQMWSESTARQMDSSASVCRFVFSMMSEYTFRHLRKTTSGETGGTGQKGTHGRVSMSGAHDVHL